MNPDDRPLLEGWLRLRGGDVSGALDPLEAATQLSPGPLPWLYLGVARHRLGDAQGSLRALDHASTLEATSPAYVALRARQERLVGSSTLAYAQLERGRERFPDAASLRREEASLLTDAGAGPVAVARLGPEAPRELAWLGRALVDAGAIREAAALIERARSEADSPALARFSAWLYDQLGAYRLAARALDPAHLGSSPLACEAADAWRRAGEPKEALRVNPLCADAARRRDQRLALLVESGALDRALALALPPKELGPVGRYALAFAFARTGRPDRARFYLDAIEAGTELPGLAALKSELSSSP